MLVEFRPHARLRGRKPADLGASVLPVVAAVSASDADLGKVRVVCDWVQYRDNFRDVVALRPILHDDAVPEPLGVRHDDLEIAVDVRRAADAPVGELTTALLHQPPDRVL